MFREPSSTESRSSGASASQTPKEVSRERRRNLLAASVLAALLVGSAISIGSRFNQALEQLTRNSLIGILSVNVATTRMWLDQRRQDVTRLMGTPNVSEAASDLILSFGDRTQLRLSELLTEPAVTTFSKNLAAKVDSEIYLGWVLLDASGRVLVSDHERLITLSLPVPDTVTSRLNRGDSAVCHAIPLPIPITPDGPQSRSGGPIMLSMAPIRQGFTTIGSFALLFDPLGEFSSLLSVAQPGKTCETYMFNRDGRMVSPSRFDNQLREMGMLAADKSVTSVLEIELRDPGVDATAGEHASLQRPSQPLTQMAVLATRGGEGEDIVGYRDYRGVRVVGAWRWIDDYDMGMATEMDVAEAYRPTLLLKQTMFGFLTLVGLATLGMLVIAWQYRQALRRDGRHLKRGRRLGQYEIGRRIGTGGMGTVHIGQHRLLKRDVAVKVLEGPDLTQRAITRFEREVQATAMLRHPNTIAIYDYGRTEKGEFFYVMEWVDGITLQRLVKEYGRQPPERVIYLLLQVCGSLSEAHHKGIVHRDIKPANIMVTAHAGLYDTVKLLDFGLVKEVDSENTILTVTDSFTGTPSYMSPEAVRDAAKVDHRSDIYSLGAVGYMLLTGVPVFEGGSAVDVCVKHINDEPMRPSERIGARLPEDLQNVLLSCLRKYPEERPRTVDELAETLQHCADASRWSIGEARRWWESIYQAADTHENEHNDETLISSEKPVSRQSRTDAIRSTEPSTFSPSDRTRAS